MPNYMQALYGSANDCGPVAAAMALAYFNKFTPGLIADSASIGKDYCFGPDWGKYSWPPFPMILKPRWYSPKGSKVLPATTTYRDWYFDHYEIDKNKCTAYQARHKLVYELSKSMPYDSIFGTWDLLTVTPGFDGFIGPTVKAVAAARAKKAATWWTADSDSTKFSTFNWHMDHNNPVLLLIKWPGNTAIGGKHSGEDISVHWMPVIGTYFEDRRAKMCMTSGWCSDCSDSLPDRRYVAVRTGWVEGQATKGGENLVTNYTLGDLGTKFSGPINTNDYTWLNFDESFPLLGSLITLGSDWYYVRFNDKTGGCNKCDPENY